MNLNDFSPGVYQPLCGWDWVRQHQGDYPNGIPVHFEVIRPGSHHTLTVKDNDTMREVIREVVRK